MFFVGGLVCLWRNARPGLFAWLSASCALAFVVIVHLGRAEDLPASLSWWMVYTGVAALVAMAAALVWGSRPRHGTRLIDAYAIMSVALATLAIGFGLERPWIAPAWAGLALGVSVKGRVLKLRWLVIPVGWLSAGCVARLIVPGPTGYALPMPVVFNTMLGQYGLPAVGFALIAWVYHNDRWPWLRAVFQALALGVSMACVSLQVRLGFHPESLWNESAGLIEWSTYAVLWLGVCWLVSAWVGAGSLQGLRYTAIGLGVIGLIVMLIHPVALANPLWSSASVGEGRIFNWLVYAYGLPGVLAILAGRAMPREAGVFRYAAVVVAFLLLFVLVSLEVRQGFVGGDMLVKTHPISQAESYGYSLTWVLLALVLLAGGLLTGSAALRYGSLAVMLVAVGKVAVDTAQLKDLWRVLSLLGLGLSLIVLGYVYQRFVFRRPRPRADDVVEPMFDDAGK